MASETSERKKRAGKPMPTAQLRTNAQRLSKAALATLDALMAASDTPAPIKLAAAREVLDRGHGRPPLGEAEPGGDDGGMTVIVKRYTDITDEELARAAEGEP
jgi:hypothetical protein